jgi:catechol 2,3-dioxygenase-like lactoylglutathione lyase family enzyme
MKRVIGIGGIFFKANDPEKLGAWYKKHLGMNVEDWGGVRFEENAGADLQPKRQSHIVWSPFEARTDYFAPSEKPFMLNYRVRDLDSVLAQLRGEGVEVDPKTERSEFGYSAGSWSRREIELNCGSRRKEVTSDW